MRHCSRAFGFTFVELLVLIMILCILSALLLPGLQRTLEHGRIVACAQNMKQIYAGTASYAENNNDVLPVLIANTNSHLPYRVRMMQPAGDGPLDWMENYCGATLNRSSLIDAYTRQYVPIVDRAVFRCPSSNMATIKSNAPEAQAYCIDYGLCFAPPSYYGYHGDWPLYDSKAAPYLGSIEYKARLKKAGAGREGYEKAFLFDNFWCDTIIGAGSKDWNCHTSGRTDGGQNVLTGGGGVRFEPYSWWAPNLSGSKAFGSPNFRVPRKYWYPVSWISSEAELVWWGVWKPNRITVCDPTLATNSFTIARENSNVATYTKYRSLW